MLNNNIQHKSILKSLFFFGSLQIFQTFIGLIKIKYVSVLIGPAGLGELTLFTTFSNTVVYIVGFGLFNSAVRNISIANANKDNFEIQRIFNLVTKIIVGTSIVVCSIIILFRKDLSILVFNDTYNNGNIFIYLVFVILFSVFTSRNNMLIQGMGRYKIFGKATLISSLLSLIIVFPLFYFFGKEAIVASLILSSFIIYIVSEYFIRPLNISSKIDFSFNSLFSESRNLLSFGIVMMVSSLIGNIVTNLINIYIVKEGSSYDLGLYNAAITISLQYVSLVFVSLSSEFYPRLSSVSNDYTLVRNMVNNQIEVILVVLFPLLILMQVFANLLVNVVLTKEFTSIIPFIQVSTIAIVFQALAYVISNIPMAMGNKKHLFLFNSLIPGIASLIFSFWGYKVFGLMGLVYSLYIVNIIHFLTMFIVVNHCYNFVIHTRVLKLIVLILCILITSLTFVLLTDGFSYYLSCGLIIITTFIYTYQKSFQIFGFSFSSLFNRIRNSII